jgi:hypothetical protein
MSFFIVCLGLSAYGQDQGFFLNEWQPETISAPIFTDQEQTTDPVTVSVKVLFNDTICKISRYLFGDNANLWTGCMADNHELMQHMADRRMGVLRGPAGSVSDAFFWNRSVDTPPDDVPDRIYNSGQLTDFGPWYGIRPYSWENWTMAVDSFYRILDQTNVTGMLTVNYGYARYGTGPTPVATAAHMAADWVRYDNGRTKFWEIGNEVFGSWEAGYQIDPSLNHDGQPAIITPTLYAQHSLVFIDSMRSAAAEIGADIKIGLVMCESSSTGTSSWDKDVASVAGDAADFYIIHSYYTPYNENSTLETILNSYHKTGGYKNYLYQETDKAGKPRLPIALTEYNIFAISSKQPVSHANGIHAVLVTGETMKTGIGAALRWDLANGWDNGNDMGMYSYGSEPGGIDTYAPRPAFYHLYFMHKFAGDVLLNSTIRGDTNVTVYPMAFSSGQASFAIVNRGRNTEVIRLNIKDFRFGSRYYTYTLTGEDDVDFSRKVWVNGTGTSLVAGGPLNYAEIPAVSSTIGDEIKIKLPPVSSTFVLVEPGDKELAINEEIYGIGNYSSSSDIIIYPNPASDKISIRNIPEETTEIRITDCVGKTLLEIEFQKSSISEIETDISLLPGIYFVTFTGTSPLITKKLIIKYQ